MNDAGLDLRQRIGQLGVIWIDRGILQRHPAEDGQTPTFGHSRFQ
jgi:hypothetical protein